MVRLDASHAASLELAAMDAAVAVPAGLGFPLRPGWGGAYCARVLAEACEGRGLALALLHEGQAVGCARLFDIDGRSAELGVWVQREHQRKGYARGALASLCDQALTQWPLRVMYARCLSGNAPGLALLLSLGFRITSRAHVVSLRASESTISTLARSLTGSEE